AAHLDVTMIHEGMVLDHGGPDLAGLLYGAALKLWLFGALLVDLALPVHSGHPALDAGAGALGMLLLAVLTGRVESSMARLRLLSVPRLLVGGGALSVLALLLVLR